ncbi:MAG: 4Fe-4S binding protein [Gammaproteobacteria bacterium]|nr:4Fe-4S binding protein [Gammaproteobacteria bacterium]
MFILKLITVAFFLLVIYAGLMGTPVPERNIATVLTWNIWWAGLIISIFFLGSAWCAICPWDALATWHVKPRLWFNNWRLNNSLELTPPRWMRSVWPALIMFAGLTWLELGYGVTTSPYATALLSLVMVVLAIISLALYKNKAFCHYICPVGRTIGFYSQLAPVELRPLNKQICVDCKTLECFSGSETVDACPTKLVMGRLTQNTYCTSCGNCVQSCPSDNVAWRLRAPSQEAIESARPHWDEAWFMLVMLALTSFHGVTMMEFWEQGLRSFAQKIGDSGQLLVSFSSGLILSVLVPVAIYALVIELTRRLSKSQLSYKKIFSSLVFATLPLAFAYHLAHNLNHMIRESVGASQLLLNPLGTNVSYSGVADELFIKNSMLLSENTIFSLQALLMMFGFWVAIKVLQHRSKVLFADSKTVVTMMPVLLFVFAVNSFHLWMLMQPMVMRIGALCVVPSIL